MEQTKSPLPNIKQEVQDEQTMTFGKAIDALADSVDMEYGNSSKRIYKSEWEDEGYYGILKDKILLLHKPTGEFHQWIISDGDILGKDWTVI